MSWSLRLRNGDLAIDGNHFETVTAEHKLIQDLRCHILEQMGTDSAHRGFGSLIDGGRKPDGRIVESVIGRIDWEYVRLEVEADLQRIFSEHQAKQLVRAKSDSFTYNKTTLTAGEVLIGVNELRFIRSLDGLIILITVRTAANSFVTLNAPFVLT